WGTAIGPRFVPQPIDQRGLAVVDVGDNGDVAKFHGSSSVGHSREARCRRKTRTLLPIALKNSGVPKARNAPKKEAPPKRPGTPYSLQRNIVRNWPKTMRCLRSGELIFAPRPAALKGREPLR